MKTLIILAVMAFVASSSSSDVQYYASEELDMNKLVENLDDLKEFTNCFLEKITCKEVYESYRVNAFDAVRHACERCTPHVKYMFSRYLQVLKTKLPGAYIEIRHKYDPENKYFDAHEEELNKYSHE